MLMFKWNISTAVTVLCKFRSRRILFSRRKNLHYCCGEHKSYHDTPIIKVNAQMLLRASGTSFSLCYHIKWLNLPQVAMTLSAAYCICHSIRIPSFFSCSSNHLLPWQDLFCSSAQFNQIFHMFVSSLYSTCIT